MRPRLPRGASAARVSTHVASPGDPTLFLFACSKHWSRSCRVRTWIRSTIMWSSLSDSGGTPGGRREIDPSTDFVLESHDASASVPPPPPSLTSPSPPPPPPPPPRGASSATSSPPLSRLSVDALSLRRASCLATALAPRGEFGDPPGDGSTSSGSPMDRRDLLSSFAMPAFHEFLGA